MSKQSLLKAVELAGSQVNLARGIRERIPDSKIGQVHVWGWLNQVKIEVPPADVVIPIAAFLDYRLTPHDLRPDLYPNPTDALPANVAEQIHASGVDRLVECGSSDPRHTPDRRDPPCGGRRITNGHGDKAA